MSTAESGAFFLAASRVRRVWLRGRGPVVSGTICAATIS